MQMQQIQMKSVDELIPYVNNPRQNDDAVDAVASSIKNFGFKVPIVVDGANEIVNGHTRLKAAKKLGLDEVPVIVADDLTPEQIKAFRLADNKVGEIAEWDNSMLLSELEELAELEFDMTQFGFDDLDFADETAEIVEDEFDEELPEEPKAKLGDIYKLGRHRLMCGDSTKEDDVAKLMDGEKADMVFTDPPWNVNYGAVGKGNSMGYKPRTIMNDFMGEEDFKNFMDGTFESMNFASKDGCMTYVVMSPQEWGNMMLTLASNDYHWSSTIIWNKDRLVMSRKDYHTKYEPIWYGWKNGDARLHPLTDRKQSDVWDIDRPKASELHPTMKPIELISRAIQNSSNKNDIVLDLFGGSGSTMIASEQTERINYSMELDPRYVDVIVRRWEEFTGEKAKLVGNINEATTD